VLPEIVFKEEAVLNPFVRLTVAAIIALCAPVVMAADVIVFPAVSQRELSVNSIRLVFTMRMLRWPDGTRIRVFVFPDDHPAHRQFAKRQLGLYPHQLRRVWDRNRYSGSGPVPVEVASVKEMMELVSATPGAIGYVPEETMKKGVEVVRVK
jgi:hypothetical protein